MVSRRGTNLGKAYYSRGGVLGKNRVKQDEDWIGISEGEN